MAPDNGGFLPRLILAAGLAGGAMLAMPAVAFAQDASTTSPVTYSNDQADRGKTRYARDCEECHGADLRGGLIGGPPLRGAAFEQKFANGAPASAMFMFMSTTMPPNAPGRFSADVYADLMAFILKQNGFQPGASLPSDVDALNNLIVEK
ncbi:MAG TPA: c-type cytochrome [Pelagibacterium sp.]|uniref:c-type cytochrome n=1 Tax=Pelagibacterium sp. TaxID=1967288 RepID=UPI002B9969AF|nr:c-type cytochrome [Pelagibacterium sp.]HWJ88413.1 c-type cytochrome [Pelagibacterium sp.]